MAFTIYVDSLLTTALFFQTQSLRIHIHTLRHKLKHGSPQPKHIRTKTEVGYQFVCE